MGAAVDVPSILLLLLGLALALPLPGRLFDNRADLDQWEPSGSHDRRQPDAGEPYSWERW